MNDELNGMTDDELRNIIGIANQILTTRLETRMIEALGTGTDTQLDQRFKALITKKYPKDDTMFYHRGVHTMTQVFECYERTTTYGEFLRELEALTYHP